MKKWVTSKHTSIYRLHTLYSNCYLIEKRGRYILVDTGVRMERILIERQLRKLGVHKMQAILLTHTHTDHVENAAYFQQKYECSSYVEQTEFNYLVKGYCKMPGGTDNYTRKLQKIATQFQIRTKFTPCVHVKAYRQNTDFTDFGQSIKILSVPGHSEGSVAIILDEEIAIVGDTMMHTGKEIYPKFADRPELLPKVWNVLLQQNCRIYLPGHGSEVTKKELQKNIQNRTAEQYAEKYSK